MRQSRAKVINPNHELYMKLTRVNTYLIKQYTTHPPPHVMDALRLVATIMRDNFSPKVG